MQVLSKSGKMMSTSGVKFSWHLIFYIVFKKKCVCVRVHACMCASLFVDAMCVQVSVRLEENVEFHGAGAMCSCEPPGMGLLEEQQTLNPMGHLSSSRIRYFKANI